MGVYTHQLYDNTLYINKIQKTLLSEFNNRNPVKTRKNRNRSTSIAVSLWCHRESNQGHKDFQSFALPTELWHQILF